MRDAATVLEIIRERGRKGLPLERVYRCLFNPDLFLLAYGKLYRNAGAMTPGTTRETVDGMSLDKIETIITVLRHERYRWTPVRRAYIDKKGTRKKRPLGLPTWSDKLVQEVIRLILEAYYEPQFSDRSHGFRPGRGCHTALGEIYHQWHGTVWFIEGDISDCFGSLDHSIMVSILAEKIHDGRFLRLIGGLLRAGYLEDWRYHRTLSGAPQGGVVSPVLSNIYLDRLDTYIERALLPAYNRGDRRTPFRPYMRLWRRLGRLHYVMERSLTKTLARKYRITVPQVYRRFRAVLDTEHGPRRGLQVTVDRGGGKKPLVAQWGGISLARDLTPTVLNDDPPKIWSGRRSELVQRLLADTCELCGSQHQVEVHHIRALKDLNPKGRKQPPEWVVRMASRRRKTLVVCRACHEGIHYSGQRFTADMMSTGEPDATETGTSGSGRGRRKRSQPSHLAGDLLHFTYGSVRAGG